MKKSTVQKLVTGFTCLFVASLTGAALPAFAEETTYYLCLSTDNYRLHPMEAAEEGYIYRNTKLTSSDDFYVTDGTRFWYGVDDYQRNMHVEESDRYSYDITFSPDSVYEATGCHLAYAYHMLDDVELTVTAEDETTSSLTLTYNPWQTERDEYYCSSVMLSAGTVLSYTTGSGVSVTTESFSIDETGNYRVLYTPSKVVGFSQYGYDENGEYGAGSDYTYHVYAELTPAYYLALEGAKEEEYLPLLRNEQQTSAEYRTQQSLFTLPAWYNQDDECYEMYYKIYRKDSVGGSTVYTLLDDGNEPDDDHKKEDDDLHLLTANDRGYYYVALTDSGSSVSASLTRANAIYGGFYAVGTFNGYGYTDEGTGNLASDYRFALMTESNADYTKDYAQYTLSFTVTNEQLEEEDVKLYITDGQSRYKNGTSDIVLNTAGKYTFTFSDEHVYSNGRRYTYTLERAPLSYTRVEVGSVTEWNALAVSCRSADWSADKEIHITADISFEGQKFATLPVFTGVFDGEGHTLSHITLTDSNAATSLVEKLTDGATWKNVNLSNLTLGGKDCEYVGVIGSNYGTVYNVTVESGSISGNRYVGGIVAYNGATATDDNSASTDSEAVRKGQIKNCTNSALIEGVGDVGGIVGFSAGDVLSCRNDGTVKGKAFRSDDNILDIGGIAGYLSGRISDCNNTARVGEENNGFYVGGIVGLSTGGLYFCTNSGDVAGRRYTGGIVGYYGTLQQDDDWSSYFGTATFGAVMNTYASEEDSDNDSSQQSTGSESVIAYCQNSGNITSVRYGGGALGNSTMTTLQLFYVTNRGDVKVTGGDYAGGIAGYLSGTLTGCYQLGAVSASGSYAGGLCGFGAGVSQSAATGVVKAQDYVGGLCGYVDTGAEVCSNYVNVAVVSDKTARYVGNIAGSAAAVEGSLVGLSDSFYANYYVGDSNCYGIASIEYGINYMYAASSIDREQLSLLPTYKNFDKDYWQKNEEGFPIPAHYQKDNADEDVADLYDDDTLFYQLFADHTQAFSDFAQDASSPYAVTVFLEWNEDDGDLYDDDGQLNVENFFILSWVRTPYGESVATPQLQYAEEKDGRLVYEGEECLYFVTLNGIESADGNTVNYCAYSEIITSLRTQTGDILVEGMFTAGAVAKLVAEEGNYRVIVERDGAELSGTVTLKVPVSVTKNSSIVVDGAEVQSKIVGSYLAFEYTLGQTFSVNLGEATSLVWWVWLIIGLAIAVVVAAVVILVVFIKRAKRRKKA